jgi:hypothetical protein
MKFCFFQNLHPNFNDNVGVLFSDKDYEKWYIRKYHSLYGSHCLAKTTFRVLVFAFMSETVLFFLPHGSVNCQECSKNAIHMREWINRRKTWKVETNTFSCSAEHLKINIRVSRRMKAESIFIMKVSCVEVRVWKKRSMNQMKLHNQSQFCFWFELIKSVFLS